MAKSLATLVRLHNWRVDEQRRELAAKLRVLEEQEAMLRTLEDELERERALAKSSPEVALFFGTYAEGVGLRREEINVSLNAAEAEADKAREAVRLAFHDLKKYEQAEESRQHAEDVERERRDRIDLDEIGLETHRRKKA